MHDSQTSNSRLSSELCCKGQVRPNNNSALVDTTRSTHSDELPPMEIVTEEESRAAALPAILLKKSNWVTDETETLIWDNRGDDDCTTLGSVPPELHTLRLRSPLLKLARVLQSTRSARPRRAIYFITDFTC